MIFQKCPYLGYHLINPKEILEREHAFKNLVDSNKLIAPILIKNEDISSIDISKNPKKEAICNNINITIKINNVLPPKSDKIFENPKKEENLKKFGLKFHNNYSVDNILRKIKTILLSSLIEFINSKISQVYKSQINKGILKKELKYFKQSNISNIEEKKAFIYKNLKDIFSIDLNSKFTNFIKTHNRIIVNELLNEKDVEKRKSFEKLFNLNFLECLDHFSGKKYIKELDGLKTLNEIFKEFEKEQEYFDLVKKCAFDFETILLKKKKRIRKKKIKNSESLFSEK